MDSIFNFFYWTPMEWEKNIPLGRQDVQDYWPWLNALHPDEISAKKISLGKLLFKV